MRFFYAVALAMLGLCASLSATADVLQMPGDSEPMAESGPETPGDSEPMSEPGPETTDDSTTMAEPGPREMPYRGMHMDQVRAKFGQPLETLPPVGDPPITRWRYDGYTVYFEYSYVIESVRKR